MEIKPISPWDEHAERESPDGRYIAVFMNGTEIAMGAPTIGELWIKTSGGSQMKFLCLAYGDEDGWNSLGEDERREVLAQDAVIRDRGSLMSAVQTKVTSVRNWDRVLEVTDEPYAQHKLPLAGFSVIEAESLKEVIELVSNTPCARARGVIEIRPFWELSRDGA